MEAIQAGCSLMIATATFLVAARYLRGREYNRDSHVVNSRLQSSQTGIVERMRQRLNRAGGGLTAGQYLSVAAVTGMVAAVFASLILDSLWLGMPAALVGLLMSERISAVVRFKRREMFEQGNVRALRIMANSLRTNPSYLRAFEQAAASAFVPKQVREEYARVVELLRGNISLDAAMRSMYLRTGSRDISRIAAILGVQREYGGDMAKTLDLAASFLLRQKQLERRQKAAMSQILAQVNLLSLMPFFFVAALYLNNPRHFDPLVQLDGGRLLLLGCFLSILLGGEAIRIIATRPLRKGR